MPGGRGCRRFARLLADDAVLYSDGGGRRRAALKPFFGRTVAFDVADDRIVAIYSVRNPDKVRHLS